MINNKKKRTHLVLVSQLARLHHRLTNRSIATHSISKYASMKLTHRETGQEIDIYLDHVFPFGIIHVSYFYDSTQVIYICTF